MTDKEMSLREASKLLQFAPQTVKKMIKDGELKAKATGTGRKRRYTIAAKDVAKLSGKPVKTNGATQPKKVGRPRKEKAPKHANGAANGTVSWQSQPFKPAEMPSAETLLRTAFMQWITEKLLAA